MRSNSSKRKSAPARTLVAETIPSYSIQHFHFDKIARKLLQECSTLGIAADQTPPKRLLVRGNTGTVEFVQTHNDGDVWYYKLTPASERRVPAAVGIELELEND